MSEEPSIPIDHSRFDKLKEWGGEGLVTQLLELFRNQTPERVASIRHGFRPEHTEEATRAAHSLRSTATNLGAMRLAELAFEAENALRSGSFEGLDGLADALEGEFQTACQALVGSTEREKDHRVKPRIAVVEDNPDNRLLIDALLGDRYEISEFETGLEAVEGIPADPPDVVLLDISLPGMDGTEVLAVLREMPELSDLPVVALTAHAMAGDREKFLALGFNDYVTKPIVDETLLIEAIERWRKPTS